MQAPHTATPAWHARESGSARDRAPDAVAACMALLDDAGWTWDGVVARRMNSRVHRIRRGSALAAVKECFDPHTGAPLAAAAEREYAALDELQRRRSHDDHALAARPLALLRTRGVYAMTWLPGRAATELLFDASAAQHAERLGALAGQWLRSFHALGAQPERRGDYAAREPLLRRIADASADRDALTHRAANVLIATAHRAAAVVMPASWMHGDMKSDNLLIEGERVSGLDVQLADINVVAYDLAPFVNHLRLLRWSPRGFLQRRRLDAMAAAFLHAYSDAAGGWTLPLLWVRAYLLLELPWSVPAGLRARIARHPPRMELARVIDALEATR